MFVSEKGQRMESTKRRLFAGSDDVEGAQQGLLPPATRNTTSHLHKTLADPEYDDLFDYYRGKSPTGVADCGHPNCRWSDPEFHSTITMSEQGAEVTLSGARNGDSDDDCLSDVETPQKSNVSFCREALGEVCNRNSLLDVDQTPTPTSKSEQKSEMGLCFPFSNMHCEDTDNAEPDNQAGHDHPYPLEKTISTMLEDTSSNSNPFTSCSWSLFSPDEDQEGSKGVMLRNRAFNVGARQSRVRQLRQDLSPFHASPRRPSPAKLFKSRSFSISDHAPAIARVSQDKKKLTGFNVMNLCTLPENAVNESPMLMRYHHTEDDGCYDSDPEDFARRRSPHRNNSNKENQRNRNFTYPFGVSSSPKGNSEDAYHEVAYHDVIQEFLNSSYTLIHHPTTVVGTGLVQPRNPLAVEAWVERGQRLHRQLMQPKWLWRLKPRKDSNFQVSAIHGIELLDISRILKIQRMDRSRYPFAKPTHSFLLRTIEDEEFCFEAQSIAERDRLVYSMKLVIARFGAKVLMGDESIFPEFFATMESSVPGGLSPEVSSVVDRET